MTQIGLLPTVLLQQIYFISLEDRCFLFLLIVDCFKKP
uniref:Uncharacterized protein n=1 Tax=Angiostrongylus cantonensis TaxID=6313 RepID=A0A0K0D061_ANGCA